jgi:ribosome biogenesis GTPase
MTAVDAYLRPGQSVAIVGSSGVGKSTLVNYLLGRDAMRTQEIRDKDDKGKHTTTARQMFLLPGGGLLIDTPGMRELQLFSHEDGLASEFADVEEIALRCRFSNCEHRTEPDCAIQAAIADGELELGRWENFQKMRRELAFQARKLDKAKASEEKEKWKKVHKALKDNPKYRR